jgi:hypothetical protein
MDDGPFNRIPFSWSYIYELQVLLLQHFRGQGL